MESLSPTYLLLLQIKVALEMNKPAKEGVIAFSKAHKNSLVDVCLALLKPNSEAEVEQLCRSIRLNPQAHYLIQLLRRGLSGESIYNHLCQLEEELKLQMQSEIDEFLATLPFKMLIPLLLFQFPAFLLILFGPAVQNLLTTMK